MAVSFLRIRCAIRSYAITTGRGILPRLYRLYCTGIYVDLRSVQLKRCDGVNTPPRGQSAINTISTGLSIMSIGIR